MSGDFSIHLTCASYARVGCNINQSCYHWSA